MRLGEDNRSLERPEKLIGEFLSGESFLAVGGATKGSSISAKLSVTA